MIGYWEVGGIYLGLCGGHTLTPPFAFEAPLITNNTSPVLHRPPAQKRLNFYWNGTRATSHVQGSGASSCNVFDNLSPILTTRAHLRRSPTAQSIHIYERNQHTNPGGRDAQEATPAKISAPSHNVVDAEKRGIPTPESTVS